MSQNVIKKAAIDQMEGLAKQHFLNPQAKRNNKSLGDLCGISGFGFHIIEVPPGSESTEFHVHYYEDECTYVLSGSGQVTIGDTSHDVSQGDFIGYPKCGQAHTMVNTGNEPLRCIVVGERLPHDVADYPRKGKRIFRNAGQPWNLVDHDNISEPQGGQK